MGLAKNLDIDLQDLYSQAESNYLLFSNETCVKGKYDVESAIAAAQYYGMMCGYMNAEKAIFQSDMIEKEIAELGRIRLFKSDFIDES